MGRAGTLSRMHQRGRIRRGQANRNPLRRVVGYDELGREELECGHKKFLRQDFIGTTYATRRRCGRCGATKT